MTTQETLDTVVLALRRQGEPSIDEFGSCVYRGLGESGRELKCAAGWLIPPADYNRDTMDDPDKEIVSAWTEPVRSILLRDGHDIELVSALQDAHDTDASEGVDTWLKSFLENAERVAVRFGLSTDALTRPLP